MYFIVNIVNNLTMGLSKNKDKNNRKFNRNNLVYKYCLC